MNTIVQAAINASLAALETTSSIPSTPYGYGSDISCESDIDPRMNEITDSALVLAQHCVRRLDTPTGLPDDDNWGMSLSSYCNRPTTRQELYELEGSIVAELVDDDRIDEVRAEVESSTDGSTLTVSLEIIPLDPLANDFSLILSVTDVSVLIEEMTA